jgi:hypothetical protein
MKKLGICITLAFTILLASCAPGTYYKNHPTTRQELIDKRGEPYRINKTDDGEEQLVYRFEGEGVTYIYYVIENGMVVRTGMYPR